MEGVAWLRVPSERRSFWRMRLALSALPIGLMEMRLLDPLPLPASHPLWDNPGDTQGIKINSLNKHIKCVLSKHLL